MKEHNQDNSSLRESLIAILFDLPWFELIGNLWKIGRQIARGLASEGVYEVIEYECTLELKDKDGKHATIHKRKKIRYLQDYITTYLDEAWGSGEILLDYQCSPGIPVDEYHLGHKTYKLISLREFRSKGDIDEFNIVWDMRDGFLLPTGFWGTAINQRMKKLTVKIIFPKDRPPLHLAITESSLKRTHALGNDLQQRLPDGRPTVIWQNETPRLYEDYILSWEW